MLLEEMTGQCKRCKDLMTVDLTPVQDARLGHIHNGLAGQDRYYRLAHNPHVQWADTHSYNRLIHRPGHCGGTVNLYSSRALLQPHPLPMPA